MDKCLLQVYNEDSRQTSTDVSVLLTLTWYLITTSWNNTPKIRNFHEFVNKFTNLWTNLNMHFENVSKGALSGLRQLLAENPLKMMKNALIYFTPKAHLVLEIFQFLFWIFSHVVNRLDKKAKVDFKIYNITNWMKSILEKSCTECVDKLIPEPF